MLITNIVNIYELNLGVFSRPKKGLDLMTGKVSYIMTITDTIHILSI